MLRHRLAGPNVGTIDREAGDHLSQRPAQVVVREVASAPISLRDPCSIDLPSVLTSLASVARVISSFAS